jgi:hypothetical protein
MDHEISISVINDSVGIPPSADGIMGIFVEGVAVGQTFLLDTPYLLTQLSDLDALGINAAYDATNGTAVYQQVSEFYAQAGDGALLWLIGVATGTAYAGYVASETFASIIRFTAQADPLNRVKIIGLCYQPPTILQTATDFPADVAATITALQTVQETLFQQGYQFSAIVDGYNMNSTITPVNLGTQATNTAYAVSLCITGTKPNGVSAVGLALGRFARITIGHGFGAVADGGINTISAYLTNSISTTVNSVLIVGATYLVMDGAITYNAVVYQPGQKVTVVMGQTSYLSTSGGYLAENVTPVGNIPGTQVKGLSPASIKALGQKQFLFIRTWFGQSGLYWNDGATCNPSTKALSSQEYNRVVNALSADALSFFIQEINSGLPLDKTTGNVAQAWLNAKQQEFYDTYIGPINSDGGTGDITDAALVVTGNNFLATKTLNFTLQIIPTVILGGVNGTVRFVATL